MLGGSVGLQLAALLHSGTAQLSMPVAHTSNRNSQTYLKSFYENDTNKKLINRGNDHTISNDESVSMVVNEVQRRGAATLARVFDRFCAHSDPSNVGTMTGFKFKKLLRTAGLSANPNTTAAVDVIFAQCTAAANCGNKETRLVFTTFCQAMSRVGLSVYLSRCFTPNILSSIATILSHVSDITHVSEEESSEDGISQSDDTYTMSPSAMTADGTNRMHSISTAVNIVLELLRRLDDDQRHVEPDEAAALLTDEALQTFAQHEDVAKRIYYHYTRFTSFVLSFDSMMQLAKDFLIFPNLVSKSAFVGTYSIIAPDLRALTYPGYLEFIGRVALSVFNEPGLCEQYPTVEDKLTAMFSRLRVCHKMTDIITEESTRGGQRKIRIPEYVLLGDSTRPQHANVSNIVLAHQTAEEFEDAELIQDEYTNETADEIVLKEQVPSSQQRYNVASAIQQPIQEYANLTVHQGKEKEQSFRNNPSAKQTEREQAQVQEQGGEQSFRNKSSAKQTEQEQEGGEQSFRNKSSAKQTELEQEQELEPEKSSGNDANSASQMQQQDDVQEGPSGPRKTGDAQPHDVDSSGEYINEPSSMGVNNTTIDGTKSELNESNVSMTQTGEKNDVSMKEMNDSIKQESVGKKDIDVKNKDIHSPSNDTNETKDQISSSGIHRHKQAINLQLKTTIEDEIPAATTTPAHHKQSEPNTMRSEPANTLHLESTVGTEPPNTMRSEPPLTMRSVEDAIPVNVFAAQMKRLHRAGAAIHGGSHSTTSRKSSFHFPTDSFANTIPVELSGRSDSGGTDTKFIPNTKLACSNSATSGSFASHIKYSPDHTIESRTTIHEKHIPQRERIMSDPVYYSKSHGSQSANGPQSAHGSQLHASHSTTGSSPLARTIQPSTPLDHRKHLSRMDSRVTFASINSETEGQTLLRSGSFSSIPKQYVSAYEMAPERDSPFMIDSSSTQNYSIEPISEFTQNYKSTLPNYSTKQSHGIHPAEKRKKQKDMSLLKEIHTNLPPSAALQQQQQSHLQPQQLQPQQLQKIASTPRYLHDLPISGSPSMVFGGTTSIAQSSTAALPKGRRVRDKFTFFSKRLTTVDRMKVAEKKKRTQMRNRELTAEIDVEYQMRTGSRPSGLTSGAASSAASTTHLPSTRGELRAAMMQSIHDTISPTLIQEICDTLKHSFQSKLRPIFSIYCALQNPGNTTECSLENFQQFARDIQVYDDYIRVHDVYLQCLNVLRGTIRQNSMKMDDTGNQTYWKKNQWTKESSMPQQQSRAQRSMQQQQNKSSMIQQQQQQSRSSMHQKTTKNGSLRNHDASSILDQVEYLNQTARQHELAAYSSTSNNHTLKSQSIQIVGQKLNFAQWFEALIRIAELIRHEPKIVAAANNAAAIRSGATSVTGPFESGGYKSFNMRERAHSSSASSMTGYGSLSHDIEANTMSDAYCQTPVGYRKVPSSGQINKDQTSTTSGRITQREKTKAIHHAKRFLLSRVMPLLSMGTVTEQEREIFMQPDAQSALDKEVYLLERLFAYYADVTQFQGHILSELTPVSPTSTITSTRMESNKHYGATNTKTPSSMLQVSNSPTNTKLPSSMHQVSSLSQQTSPNQKPTQTEEEEENTSTVVQKKHITNMHQRQNSFQSDDSIIQLRSNDIHSNKDQHSGEELDDLYTMTHTQVPMMSYEAFDNLVYGTGLIPKLVSTSVVASVFHCAANIHIVQNTLKSISSTKFPLENTHDAISKPDTIATATKTHPISMSEIDNQSNLRLSFAQFRLAIFLLALRGFAQPYLESTFPTVHAKVAGLTSWIRGAPNHPLEELSRNEWQRGFSYRGRRVDGSAARPTNTRRSQQQKSIRRHRSVEPQHSRKGRNPQNLSRRRTHSAEHIQSHTAFEDSSMHMTKMISSKSPEHTEMFDASKSIHNNFDVNIDAHFNNGSNNNNVDNKESSIDVHFNNHPNNNNNVNNKDSNIDAQSINAYVENTLLETNSTLSMSYTNKSNQRGKRINTPNSTSNRSTSRRLMSPGVAHLASRDPKYWGSSAFSPTTENQPSPSQTNNTTDNYRGVALSMILDRMHINEPSAYAQQQVTQKTNQIENSKATKATPRLHGAEKEEIHVSVPYFRSHFVSPTVIEQQYHSPESLPNSNTMGYNTATFFTKTPGLSVSIIRRVHHSKQPSMQTFQNVNATHVSMHDTDINTSKGSTEFFSKSKRNSINGTGVNDTVEIDPTTIPNNTTTRVPGESYHMQRMQAAQSERQNHHWRHSLRITSNPHTSKKQFHSKEYTQVSNTPKKNMYMSPRLTKSQPIHLQTEKRAKTRQTIHVENNMNNTLVLSNRQTTTTQRGMSERKDSSTPKNSRQAPYFSTGASTSTNLEKASKHLASTLNASHLRDLSHQVASALTKIRTGNANTPDMPRLSRGLQSPPPASANEYIVE